MLVKFAIALACSNFSVKSNRPIELYHVYIMNKVAKSGCAKKIKNGCLAHVIINQNLDRRSDRMSFQCGVQSEQSKSRIPMDLKEIPKQEI